MIDKNKINRPLKLFTEIEIITTKVYKVFEKVHICIRLRG